jgi:hypothetical protein
VGVSCGITDENWSISGCIVFTAPLLWMPQHQQVSISYEGVEEQTDLRNLIACGRNTWDMKGHTGDFFVTGIILSLSLM